MYAKNAQNFDPSPASIMQTCTFKDPLSLCICANCINYPPPHPTPSTSPPLLISTCFVLPYEMKQIAYGSTITFTFIVLLMQKQCTTNFMNSNNGTNY